MDYEVKDCIDCGSEFCPCHLSETGDCIICSQLKGKEFCDCINWKGVCIYQEFIQNRGKAKPGRKNFQCKILKKEEPEKDLVVYTFNAPRNLVNQLVYPGSVVFVRDPQTDYYYDTPISVMEALTDENKLKLAIEIKGIKTKSLCKLKEGEDMLIKGPFWNGVLGLKNLYKAKDGVSILIIRGIGVAPAIPVLRKLYSQGNRVITIVDKKPYKNLVFKEYFDICNSEIIQCSTLEGGELSGELKDLINSIVEIEKVNLIHCDGPDILIYKLIEYLDPALKISSCNNAKMCCGEGVCGTCSSRYKGHVVKKLCKLQIEPRRLFKEKRLI